MDNSKFFRVIWRINALLILLALVLVISTTAYDELYRRSHQPTDSGFYNYTTYEIDEDSEAIVETRWRYGRLVKVPGAPNWMLSLRSEWLDEDGSLQLHLTRNILFINAELGNSWLLSDNNSNILNYELVTTEGDETVAILYDISRCMDNGCTEWSEAAIYLSHTDGSGLTQVVDQVSRRVDQAMSNDDHLMVVYVQDEIAYAAKVSLMDFAVTESVALPPVE